MASELGSLVQTQPMSSRGLQNNSKCQTSDGLRQVLFLKVVALGVETTKKPTKSACAQCFCIMSHAQPNPEMLVMSGIYSGYIGLDHFCMHPLIIGSGAS